MRDELVVGLGVNRSYLDVEILWRGVSCDLDGLMHKGETEAGWNYLQPCLLNTWVQSSQADS